jgi:hypothetical protein
VLAWFAVWGFTRLIQLFFLYPRGEFRLKTPADLLSSPMQSLAEPVEVRGDVVMESPRRPSSKAMIVVDSVSLPLDRFGAMEWAAMVFSVPSYSVFKEPVILRGWWRSGKKPYLEVQVVSAGKIERKSLVRALRWAVAGASLAISLLLYFLTAA